MSDDIKPKNIIESAISGLKGRDIYKQVDRYRGSYNRWKA